MNNRIRANKSLQIGSMYIDRYRLLLNLVFCLSVFIHKFKCTLCYDTPCAHFSNLFCPFFSSKHIFHFDAVCVCVSSYGTSRKKPHIFYSKLLLFICYFVAVYCDFCDTILFFILIIYLLLFCQSSATLSEQIYVFQ